MPQLQLPIFPAGAEEINRNIAVQCKDGMVVYIHGHLPVYQHEEGNLKPFRYYTSQLIDSGAAKAGEIAKAFGVPLATVKRYVKVYREQKEEGFFETRPRQRSETKLTEEIKRQAEELLEAGENVAAVGRRLNVLPTTLHKAIMRFQLLRHRSERLVVKKNADGGSRASQHQKRAKRGRQASPDGQRHYTQLGTGGGIDGATGISASAVRGGGGHSRRRRTTGVARAVGGRTAALHT